MTPTGSGIPRLMALCFVLLASGAAAAATAILEHSPTWTIAGDQPYALLGCAVASAGDVNGDGHDDVLIGARFHDGTHANEGRAALHMGSPSGLAPSASWIADGGQAGALFAYSMASAGDVNGDGFDDVIVGAPLHDGPPLGGGRVVVYHGSASGLSLDPAWSYRSSQAHAELGTSVASAGDVNGDGFGDVIAGAPYNDGVAVDEGLALVFLGSPAGLSADPAWRISWGQEWALLGSSVASAGDVNGDGFGDVIVGAPAFDNGQNEEGRAAVYLGSLSGPGGEPAWMAEGDQGRALFGRSVAPAGDVNGDGFDDVIVGAPLGRSGEADEGLSFLYLGSAEGLRAEPDWSAQGDQAGAWWGAAVALAGDVNGDGYDDVIVGAGLHDRREVDVGRAVIYLGGRAGLSDDPAWMTDGDQAGAQLGYAVASAGDVNGDGLDDVIVGAYRHDERHQDAGRVLVFLAIKGGR